MLSDHPNGTEAENPTIITEGMWWRNEKSGERSNAGQRRVKPVKLVNVPALTLLSSSVFLSVIPSQAIFRASEPASPKKKNSLSSLDVTTMVERLALFHSTRVPPHLPSDLTPGFNSTYLPYFRHE